MTQRRSDVDVDSPDICIVGGGAAGITLARELAGSSRKVVLIETGGFDAASSNRGSYSLTSDRRVTAGLDPSMPSYLGGATNYWFGNNRPLDATDFEKRPWIPHSGWPIDLGELAPYYERAQVLAGLGSSTWYDVEACRPHLAHPPIESGHAVVDTRIVHTCPVLSFAELHQKQLADSRDVAVMLGDPGDSLEDRRARLTGRRRRDDRS